MGERTLQKFSCLVEHDVCMTPDDVICWMYKRCSMLVVTVVCGMNDLAQHVSNAFATRKCRESSKWVLVHELIPFECIAGGHITKQQHQGTVLLHCFGQMLFAQAGILLTNMPLILRVCYCLFDACRLKVCAPLLAASELLHTLVNKSRQFCCMLTAYSTRSWLHIWSTLAHVHNPCMLTIGFMIVCPCGDSLHFKMLLTGSQTDSWLKCGTTCMRCLWIV